MRDWPQYNGTSSAKTRIPRGKILFVTIWKGDSKYGGVCEAVSLSLFGVSKMSGLYFHAMVMVRYVEGTSHFSILISIETNLGSRIKLIQIILIIHY